MPRFHDTLSRWSQEDRPAIITPEREVSWRALHDASGQLAVAWKELARQRVGLATQASADVVAALAALDRLAAHVVLLPPDLSIVGASAACQDYHLAGCAVPAAAASERWQLVRSQDPAIAAEPGLTILTSGTEGRPKAVDHSWTSLFRPLRESGDGTGQRWLMSYRLQLYAGLQVLVQALGNGGCLVIPSGEASPREIVHFLATAATTHASATPSYWRRLILFASRAELQQIPLRQITLGGEPADQLLLDSLRQAFPAARLVHIYATTELGRCFSVADGFEGFPSVFLQAGGLPDVELRIHEGELWVRPADAARRGASAAAETPGCSVRSGDSGWGAGWHATGDLVRQEADRVLFAGRHGDLINVGGNKVHPYVVESVLRTVPGVRDVMVYGQPSSLAGNLVACLIVADRGEDEDALRQRVAELSRRRLARHEVPRVIRLVDSIDLTAAGKRQRSSRGVTSQGQAGES